MDILYAVAALGSALAAILAWAAKLWWGKEHAAAKDEVIRAKEEQIKLLEKTVESYKDLTPMKIREYFTSVKLQLEEYNESLKEQLQEAQEEVLEKNSRIEELSEGGLDRQQELERVRQERDQIVVRAQQLKDQVSELRQQYESEEVIVLRLPRIEPEFFAEIERTSRSLRNALVHPSLSWESDFARLSNSLSRATSEAIAQLSTMDLDLASSVASASLAAIDKSLSSEEDPVGEEDDAGDDSDTESA